MAGEESLANEDWRSGRYSLPEQLWYMYQNELSVDLKISVMSDNKQKVYRCHKMILRRLTPVFDPSNDHPEDSFISLDVGDVDPDIFSMIIRFAYTDQLDVDNVKDLISVHKLSTLYQMKKIRKECNKLFFIQANKDNIWDLVEYIQKEPDLAYWSSAFLSKNTSACLKSPNFLDCSQEVLKFLLDQEQLNVTEVQLVKEVIRWATHKNQGVALDAEKSKELLGPCLRQIRFLCLKAFEFSEHVAQSGLLAKEDCLSILIILSSNKMQMVPLPDYISTLETPRMIPEKSKCKLKLKNSDPEQSSAKLTNGANGVNAEEKDKALVEPEKKDKEQKQPVANASNPDFNKFLRVNWPVNPIFKQNMFVLQTPGESSLEIQVSKEIGIRGFRFTSQAKKSESVTQSTYKEQMFVAVKDVSTSKQIAYQMFNGDVPYGPNKNFEVIFKNPHKLKANNSYIILAVFRKPGKYQFLKRVNVVTVKDLTIKFGTSDTAAAPILSFYFDK